MELINEKIQLVNREYYLYGDHDANYLIVQPVDFREYQMTINEEWQYIKAVSEQKVLFAAPLITEWNIELSPWKAKAAFGKNDFGDGANMLLAWIVESMLPKLRSEKQILPKTDVIIAGYSLAGLFSLWAAYQTDCFCGIAAASPSVWFPKWFDYILINSIKVKKVYLSLGDSEEKTKNRLLSVVGNNIRQYNRYLRENEKCQCVLEWNKGNHFCEPGNRTARGILWVMNNANQRDSSHKE